MKLVFKTLALVAAAAMLLACGGQKPADKPAAPKTAALVDPTTPVKLEFYTYKQESQAKMPDLIKAFNVKHPNITIETIIIPDDQNKTLNARAASGKLFDLVQLQGYDQVKGLAKDGQLLDLSGDAVMAKVLDGAKAAVTFEGKQYALPMDFAGIGILYNKAIFAKYNLTPPTTYDELQKVAQELKKNGVTPFAGLLKDNWSIGHFLTLVHTTLLGAKGGTAAIDKFIADMNAKTTSYGAAVDFDQVLAVLDFYKANMDPKAVDMGWDQQQKDFAEEKAAMMVQGLWSYGPAKKTNPKLDVGYVPFPVTNNPADSKFYADTDSTIGIAATSTQEKQNAAKIFLDWLASPEAVKIWTGEIKLTSTFKGADVSTMETPFQDLMNSVGSKGAYPWAFSNYPNPTWETAVKTAAHGYIKGMKKKAELVADIDKSWAEELAKATKPATDKK